MTATAGQATVLDGLDAPNTGQGSVSISYALSTDVAPTITSADNTTFAAGGAGSFTVTTTPGFPASTTLTKTGDLPDGVSFSDNGDGTATLAGTPSTGGTYPLTITAANAAGQSDQSFTLTVNALPAITSANHATLTAGSAGKPHRHHDIRLPGFHHPHRDRVPAGRCQLHRQR